MSITVLEKARQMSEQAFELSIALQNLRGLDAEQRKHIIFIVDLIAEAPNKKDMKAAQDDIKQMLSSSQDNFNRKVANFKVQMTELNEANTDQLKQLSIFDILDFAGEDPDEEEGMTEEEAEAEEAAELEALSEEAENAPEASPVGEVVDFRKSNDTTPKKTTGRPSKAVKEANG